MFYNIVEEYGLEFGDWGLGIGDWKEGRGRGRGRGIGKGEREEGGEGGEGLGRGRGIGKREEGGGRGAAGITCDKPATAAIGGRHGSRRAAAIGGGD